MPLSVVTFIQAWSLPQKTSSDACQALYMLGMLYNQCPVVHMQFLWCYRLQRDTSANMSDHTTSWTLFQELVPFALALKLMLHELSMSLTTEAHVKDPCQRLMSRIHNDSPWWTTCLHSEPPPRRTVPAPPPPPPPPPPPEAGA
jgi:hypothetical protein